MNQRSSQPGRIQSPEIRNWTSAAMLLVCLALLVPATRATERVRLNFNPDWKFLKADPPGAAASGFNDSTWARVSTPHTFNDTDTFDDWSVPGHVGETNLWSGRTWYRKSFVLPEAYRGKRVYIEFEAVRQVAEVYINGHALGTNRTGFLPFGFDLTPYLSFGATANVLAVMADNRFTSETELARIAATELPWNSPHWHPPHGGIYRNVYLHVTDPLHISLPLYSFLRTAGPYVFSTNISASSANVGCELPIQNDRAEACDVSAEVEILDRSGQIVAVARGHQQVAAGASGSFALLTKVKSPELWEPAYPYIYKAVCKLVVKDEAVDSCEIPFGIRSVRFDVNTGFYINGHHLKLHGWGQRPTSEWPGLGAAQPDWMHYYTLALMKEAGGNFVRWGHCAGAPADIATADQLGMLVLQPGVDGEGDAKGSAWRLRADAFRDMLLYYRNHPSIILWEGGNQKVSREHARELRGYVDSLDPHGGRAYAHRRADQITGEFMDVDIGTEGGRQVPRLPVVEGEYNREESPRRVWDNFSPPNFGYPEAKGQTYDLTSEQFAIDEVTQFVTKLGAVNHCGGAKWIFSDTTSGGRVACEVTRASGEVDAVRLPKQGYYVCQAMFKDEPRVHIIGHWSYPAGTRKTVHVAGNCQEIELLLNGKSLGRTSPTNRYLFTFPAVAWEPGELKAQGYTEGKLVATQTLRTSGRPVALRMTPLLGPAGLLADGSDIALLDVEAVDTNGDRCPTLQQRVDFKISGEGIWRGGYNSGKTNSINHRFLDLECGVNRVAVRATRVAGKIKVEARSGALRPATITLISREVPIKDGLSPLLPALPAPQALTRAVVAEPFRSSDKSLRAQTGRFLSVCSYSGPAGTVTVQSDAEDGRKIYSDHDLVFTGLPELLRGSDWIQTANSDQLYSAADLIDLGVSTDATVYIAHDRRLSLPPWLRDGFKPAGICLGVSGQLMNVFERRLRAGQSLTLGSNTEQAGIKSCNMYIVFVKGTHRGPT